MQLTVDTSGGKHFCLWLFLLLLSLNPFEYIYVAHPFHHQALDLRHRARMCQLTLYAAQPIWAWIFPVWRNTHDIWSIHVRHTLDKSSKNTCRCCNYNLYSANMVSTKYSIAHSHAWAAAHSNLANCKFTLV